MSLHYFLRSDLDLLKIKIRKIQQEIDDAGKRVAEACEQGAETYHDNSPYDEAVRHQQILSQQLVNLFSFLNGAYPVDPPKSPQSIEIGTRVVINFVGNDESMEVIVGSFMNVANEENTI